MTRSLKVRPLQACLLAAVTLLAVLVTAPTANASGPNCYLVTYRAEVLFVEFTAPNGKVDGEMYDNTLAGALPSLYVNSENSNFVGTDNSGRLTLFFGGSTSAVFGSVNVDSLSLQIPQSDGSLSTVTLSRSSVAAYDQILAKWHQEISAANGAAAAAAQKAAAAAKKAAHLLKQLNAAVNKVDNDLSIITSPGTLEDDEGVLSDDVGVVDNDLGVVQDDNQVFADDIASDSSPCGDIRSAYGDAHTAYTDGESIVSDAKSGVGGDLRDERGAMAAAPSDWAAYWRAQQALPSYHPTQPIPRLKTALTAGRRVTNGAVSQVNSDIRQANRYIAKAYAIVNAVNMSHHCGVLEKAPTIGYVTAQRLMSA
jgi:hypothetical protein